jgi:hypothetical protein
LESLEGNGIVSDVRPVAVDAAAKYNTVMVDIVITDEVLAFI